MLFKTLTVIQVRHIDLNDQIVFKICIKSSHENFMSWNTYSLDNALIDGPYQFCTFDNFSIISIFLSETRHYKLFHEVSFDLRISWLRFVYLFVYFWEQNLQEITNNYIPPILGLLDFFLHSTHNKSWKKTFNMDKNWQEKYILNNELQNLDITYLFYVMSL